MKNFVKSIYKSLFNKEKSKSNYNSLDVKKIHTIKDFVNEAARNYKTKTYIRYKVENEIQDVTFEDMLNVCEIYNAWIYKEIEDPDSDRGVHVGLLGIGSYNYYVAYLSTMYSGNVTIPIDPNLDLDTLTYCINHGDIDMIFYEPKYESKINSLKERCPNVKHYVLFEKNKENPSAKNLDDIMEKYKNQRVIKQIKPNDNALMIYTSGTTGKKKGVVLTHDNLIDKFFSTFSLKGNETEIYLCVLPLYHIFSSNDFLFSLRFGFTVCFNFDLSKLVQNLQLYQPTKTSLVPLLAKNLLNMINMNIQEHPNLSVEEAKRQIVGKNFYKIQSGGGYLSPELTEGFNKLGILIGQGYGLTETASKCSISDFNPKKVASVGRVCPNTKVRIQNGEIQIKCKAVMKEYYKDPERTKEAFTEDGWLHTGDIGHFDDDGYLYLVGREKNLIILSNGENVSPEALESLYHSEPLVQEILVYGYEDVLCAEVYPNFKYVEMNNISKEEIKEKVWNIIEVKNKDLPSYERIVKLNIRNEPFAKTASKKIIRGEFMKELEIREKNREVKEIEVKKPMNEIQSKLSQIIFHALGNKDFGIDSDLYEFGLDSFSCTIIMNEIRKEFNIPISLNYVVHNSSVEKLEKYISEYKKDDNEETIDFSKRDVYPTVLSQIYSFGVYKGFTQGNIPCLFRLHEDVDLLKLKESIEKLIDINYELKATIHLDEEGKYKNYRHDERKADIKISKLTDKEWEEVRKGLIYPYNFTEDELLYHIDIYETETYNYLYFDISHLMCDGISYRNLIDELNDIYEGKIIEPKKYSFFEYSLENTHNFLEVFKRERSTYHNKLLEGLTLHDNPFMRKDAYNSKPYVDAQFIDTYSKIDVDKFHAFCESKSITDNALFMFAAAHALNLYENINDCALISLHNGRISERWNRVCGYVAKYYQFRLTEVENEKVVDAIHRSGKQIMETMCTTLPFITKNNFFFQYQGRIRDFNEIGGKPVVQEDVLIDSTFNQLSVFLRKNKFRYVMNYWSNVYDTQQLDNYIHIIEDIVVGIINGTEYIKDLRSQISEKYFTNKRSSSVEELNEAIGKKIFTCEDEKNTYINTYILNSQLEKQFIGGWGDIYVEENEYINVKEKDSIDNPFGEGKLFKIGYTGKFLPDENQSINVLENDCRFIMWALLGFERYQNINIIEKTLEEYEGIERASTDLKFTNGEFSIISNIYGEKEPDIEKVKEYLKSKLEERIVPSEIIY
eukprot:jgi/Orpsp1_1/1188275/evm.model.d7180000063571.1